MQYMKWRVAQAFELLATVRYAWRRTWRLGLGDRVIVDGRRTMWLAQGVSIPNWECVDCSTGERLTVHERRMRKVRTLRNYLHSFRSGWSFHMGYWFAIGVGRRLGFGGAYYGTNGYLARRQRQRDRAYLKRAERALAQQKGGGS